MEDYRLITEWGTYYFICPWCGNKHDNGMENMNAVLYAIKNLNGR